MQASGEVMVQQLGLAGDDEDARLWQSTAAGDVHAFERLMDRHSPKVVSVAARLLDDANDVEDVVQETFIRAYRHARDGRKVACVRAWLLRTAINLCRNQRRGFFRRLRLEERACRATTAAPDADHLAEGVLRQQEIESAVRALPETLRVPFVLRFFEELSGAEIAAVLNCAESTVWTRIYTARRELRKRLGEPGKG